MADFAFQHPDPHTPFPQDLQTASFELAARRTGLSFQRTRMSADRTLMSNIRTALSLIGFGFTIVQFFHYLRKSTNTVNMIPLSHERLFGVCLLVLGIAMLIAGLIGHIRLMQQIRHERQLMIDQHLVQGKIIFPLSTTWAVAFLLLLLGLTAMIGMTFRIGPFG